MLAHYLGGGRAPLVCDVRVERCEVSRGGDVCAAPALSTKKADIVVRGAEHRFRFQSL